MALGKRGKVYVPMNKYPDQNYAATLWAGKGKQWNLLATFPSEKDQPYRIPSIAGPDK